MHPTIFQIGSFTVYSYGFCIMLGVIFGYIYVVKNAKNELGIDSEKISEIVLLIIVAAIIGGKVFLYLADLPRYLANPSEMLSDFGSGFVFYGSFIFAVPTLLWYFKKNKMPALKMLDITAIGGTIVHGMGKIGCFLSGCCYGKVCDTAYGVVFSNIETNADPMNTPLYPVQLIDATLLFGICILLIFVKKRKQFDGQLLLLYVIIYGIGRFFTEFLRGDSDRGTVFNGLLSHSQFIGLCMVFIGGLFYFKLLKNSKI
jgi:phosphatidylglycerol---prolipoprotein diacylglyceryl transferase